MRTRPIDIILLVALVAVSGAIIWTLFSLGGGTASAPEGNASPPQDSPPAVTLPGEEAESGEDDAAQDDGGVVPIAPGDDGGEAASQDGSGAASEGGDGEVDDASGEADGDTASGEGTTGTEDDAADDAAADDAEDGTEMEAVETAPLEPVPDGVVPLQRIGFSYVTGGAGACEIVLEPWEHVAVSRELLDAYGCGAEVMVELEDETGGRSQVRAVVADTMNPSFSRTVNVYVAEDEPALDYGLTTGNIAPLE